MPLMVNGREYDIASDPRTSLLDFLRRDCRLTGTKKGCDHGQCGACTVLVNGQRINSCLTLAIMHDGDSVTTIEGLGTPERSASAAGRLCPPRRISMRLLYARADLLGQAHAGREAEPAGPASSATIWQRAAHADATTKSASG